MIMTGTDNLRIELADGVATLTLCRVERRNALDDALIAALTGAFRCDWSAHGVHVLVLGGDGPCFCAGADLDWMRRALGQSEAQARSDSVRLAEMFQAASALDVPLVLRAHGALLGGAVGLAAVADFVVAARSTVFQLSEVRLGLIPALITPYLVRRLGEASARAWMLAGDRLSADQARHIGLVTEVVDDRRLDLAVSERLDTIRLGAPGAQAAIKRLLRRLDRAQPDKKFGLTVAALTERRRSAEAAERIAAFFARRDDGQSV